MKYVEEDARGSVVDTQFFPPWGLDRIDQISGLNNQYVFNATGSGVSAYVIDTGIRATHVEFGGRASIAANFVGFEFCDAPGNNDPTVTALTSPALSAEVHTALQNK